MGSRDLAAIALKELRKESQDIYNRIHSIAEDAEFVKQVHRYYRNLPLLREFGTDAGCRPFYQLTRRTQPTCDVELGILIQTSYEGVSFP